MGAVYLVPTGAWMKVLLGMFDLESEDSLVLRWEEDEEAEDADGYNLELTGAEIGAVTETGVAFRDWVSPEALRASILIPLEDELKLRNDGAIAGVFARKNEIDSNGLPKGDDILVHYYT